MLYSIRHTLMENFSGLIVQGDLTKADGHAERRVELDMISHYSPGSIRRLTLGADKGYDAVGFVAELCMACVRPMVRANGAIQRSNSQIIRQEGSAQSNNTGSRSNRP